MTQYFLIESRSPFDSPEVSNNYRMAADLANQGNQVTLLLVENGVLAARSSAQSKGLADLSQVQILADDFSLRERGISTTELGYDIQTTSINSAIDALADGAKTIWL